MHRIVLALVSIGALAGAGVAEGAPHLVTGHPLDFAVQSGLNQSDSSKELVGSTDYDSSVGPDVAGFLVFRLPAPSGDELPIVQHAKLSVHVDSLTADPGFSLDLYGLPRARMASELNFSDADAPYFPEFDYYAGPATARTAAAGNLIQQALVVPQTAPLTWATTSSSANQALAAHLTELYADNGAGKFALFRLNPDANDLIHEQRGYLLDFAGIGSFDEFDADNAVVWHDEGLRPHLEITFVPEPHSCLMAGGAVAAHLLRRRKLLA